MSGQNLTQGSIPKQLWSLAWPMMLSMFFNSLYNLVDAIWVAKISASAIAAVSISQIVLFAMLSLAMGVSVGTSVLVGHKIGAEQKEEAERILGQGYLLTLIAAGFFTFFVFVFREKLLLLSGAVGEIFPLAMPYFNVVTLGSVLMFLMMTTSISFNAQGDNFTTTKLFALSTLVNVILDPIFIFGYFGFPKLGIEGAAYATLISQFIFVVLSMRILMKPSMMVSLKIENLGLQWQSVKQVIDIGLPASLNQVLNPLGFSLLMSLVSASFLEEGAAAFSIGFRIEFFAFIPAIGFGFGAMSLIGQNMGAKKLDRVKESLKKAIIYGSGSAIFFSLVCFIFAPQIVGIFTADPKVTQYSLEYFYIVPIGYVFFAVAFIEANVFQGIGRSWPGFWITFVRISLAVVFSAIATKALALPIWAVWSSIVVGSLISAVLGFFWLVKALDNAKPEEAPQDYVLEAEEVIPQV